MKITNDNKELSVLIGSENFERIPIKTHVFMEADDLFKEVKKYAEPVLVDNDILFVTEKIVAITQGRAFPLKSIKPRKLAYTLSRFVTKTPHGIGLGMPETMEMALRECGVSRILLAAAAGAVGKAIGRKGDFYNVAGYKARSIDGPTNGTIPPYNEYVVLGPLNPDKVAQDIKKLFNKNIEVVVVDINDLGGNILGFSDKNKMNEKLILDILEDNPLGQKAQSTPMGIIRKV